MVALTHGLRRGAPDKPNKNHTKQWFVGNFDARQMKGVNLTGHVASLGVSLIHESMSSIRGGWVLERHQHLRDVPEVAYAR